MPVTPIASGFVDALVDEQAEQVLHVAALVALVGEPHPAAVAARRGARVHLAAGAAEAARAGRYDGVALLGVVDVVVVVAACRRRRSGVVVSNEPLSPPQPCSITIVGNGPSPVAGSVTSTSSGTPSKLATRCESTAVGQNSTPFCGEQA